MQIMCAIPGKPYRYEQEMLQYLGTKELDHISDEDALCPMNPDYSCVTCTRTECEGFGTRFASCGIGQHKS